MNISGVYRNVHRVLYEIEVRPLGPDEVLDHTCRNPPCCRPDHLDPVTDRVNIMRGVAPTILLHNAGVCQNGHSAELHACRKRDGRVAYCRACRREKRAANGKSSVTELLGRTPA
jgi:hypothetical protein